MVCFRVSSLVALHRRHFGRHHAEARAAGARAAHARLRQTAPNALIEGRGEARYGPIGDAQEQQQGAEGLVEQARRGELEELVHELLGHADRVRHEQGYGVAAPALGQRLFQPPNVIGGDRRAAVVEDQGRFIHQQSTHFVRQAAGCLEGQHRAGRVVLTQRLRPALERLNPDLPPAALDVAIETLTRDRGAMSLARANAEVYAMLRDGVRVTFTDPETGEQRVEAVRVIAWEDPDANDYLLVSQFWVTGEFYTRRADLVAALCALTVLAAAALITPAAAMLPHEFQRYAAIPMGIAFIWLGFALWFPRRTAPANSGAMQPAAAH